jgi:organic radical activating enzyme
LVAPVSRALAAGGSVSTSNAIHRGGPTGTLPVVETFHSLQGEGVHAGRGAFFIRLAGCSVACAWCDTKHSWPAEVHPERPLRSLAEEARQARAAGAAFVVITGGEPLQHRLEGLCAALRSGTAALPPPGTAPAPPQEGAAPAPPQGVTPVPPGGIDPGPQGRSIGLPLHLETSGVHPLSGHFNWITLSPKPHRPPTGELLAACHELKVVVHGPEDLTFAEAMAQAAVRGRGDRPGPHLLLQPGWDSPTGQELAVAFVRGHPQWRLSLQSHKWLGVR